jgi:hypothetical protein
MHFKIIRSKYWYTIEIDMMSCSFEFFKTKIWIKVEDQDKIHFIYW